nr:ribonuclease H-like domain-containing protein [Tanacetum cinerariifolium]
MRPFRCPVTILNTKDHLGKFNGKADEGLFIRYYLNSKAFSVFNSRTRIVEENLHIRFSESTPNVIGSGPDWLFDIDALTRIMNYEPIDPGTQSNGFVGTKREKTKPKAYWKKILYDALIDDLMTEDKIFDPRGDIDEIDAFLDIDIFTDIKDGYYDSEGDVLYLESLLSDDTTPNLPPEEFLDRDPRSLSNINDMKIRVKVFDIGIHEKIFSPTYVSLSVEDRHYLFFTYVIRIFLPYFTYLVNSPFLLSSRSEDTIFDPDISAFHFSLSRWHLIRVELSCASIFIQTS